MKRLLLLGVGILLISATTFSLYRHSTIVPSSYSRASTNTAATPSQLPVDTSKPQTLNSSAVSPVDTKSSSDTGSTVQGSLGPVQTAVTEPEPPVLPPTPVPIEPPITPPNPCSKEQPSGTSSLCAIPRCSPCYHRELAVMCPMSSSAPTSQVMCTPCGGQNPAGNSYACKL